MKPKFPDKELRQFETIYRTFKKMDEKQRLRTLNFLIDKYNCDVKNKTK